MLNYPNDYHSIHHKILKQAFKTCENVIGHAICYRNNTSPIMRFQIYFTIA